MFNTLMSFVGAASVAMLACGSGAQAAAVPATISAAVADASRPAADRERDANRRPAELIAFAGLKRGEHVAELLPGTGYFTRIFSKIVGDTGVVYALVPPPRPNAPPGAPSMGAAAEAIAADPNYKNVRVVPLTSPAPELVDLVWTSDNYHDLHNRPNADLAAFNKTVFDELKPGGTYMVIDHAAAAGAGTSVTGTLHRIDIESVKSEVLAAGFKLAGESDVLRNPDDPHTASIRDASIRGRTDQFVLKFVKPK